MKNILLTLMLAMPAMTAAQSLSWKSSDIHLDLAQNVNTSGVPQINWKQPGMEFTSSEKGKIKIIATVTSSVALANVGLKVLNTKSNVEYASKVFTDVKGNSYNINVDILITEDGTFALEITSQSESGITSSSRRDLIIGKDALDFISADRKDYALIFAIDNYDNWDDLVNPVNDGNAIAKELQEKYGFTTEVIENATTEEVFEKLRDYNERKFKPQDQLLVFFAGHGLFDDTFGEGYVVAKNSLENDKSRTSYIAHARLRGVVNNIPCQHILLVMDVCFGGTLDAAIGKSRSAADEITPRQMLARKLSYKTRKYLTSGGKEYVPDGEPGHHSPFASKMIESLRSFGGEDRILTLSEVHSFVEKLKVLPRFGSFGDDESLSDFVFIAK